MSTTVEKCSYLLAFAVPLVVAIAILSWRPYAPESERELLGSYTFDCDLVDGQLILRSDGEFGQTLLVKSTSQRLLSEGTWTYRTRVSHGITLGEITLDGLINVLSFPDELEADLNSNKPSLAIMLVWDWRGQIVLGEEIDGRPVWKKNEQAQGRGKGVGYRKVNVGKVPLHSPE